MNEMNMRKRLKEEKENRLFIYLEAKCLSEWRKKKHRKTRQLNIICFYYWRSDDDHYKTTLVCMRQNRKIKKEERKKYFQMDMRHDRMTNRFYIDGVVELKYFFTSRI